MRHQYKYLFIFIIWTSCCSILLGNPNRTKYLTSLFLDVDRNGKLAVSSGSAKNERWGELLPQFDVFPNELAVGDVLYWGFMNVNSSGKRLLLDHAVKTEYQRCRNEAYKERPMFYQHLFNLGDSFLMTEIRDPDTLSTIRGEHTGFYPRHVGKDWVECRCMDAGEDWNEDEKIYRCRIEMLPLHFKFKKKEESIGQPLILGRGTDFMLEPGRKILLLGDSIELPPLEDWNHPFWKKIQEGPPEGYLIELRWSLPDPECFNQEVEISSFIRIKPRKKTEARQILQWYNSTPKQFFPEENDFRKAWRQSFQETLTKDTGVFSSRYREYLNVSENGVIYPIQMPLASFMKDWTFFTEINGEKLYPQAFMALGNRKPYGSGIPKNLEDWRNLEQKWSLGTLRDEIQMTRHILEILEYPGIAARKEKEVGLFSETFAMDCWMESLPDVQRLVMLKKISTRFRFPITVSSKDFGFRTIKNLLHQRYQYVNHWKEWQEMTILYPGRFYRK